MAFRKTLADAARAFKALDYIDCVSPNEAAAFLNRTIETLAHWRKLGTGPEWKKHSDGWHILYPIDGLVRWVVYEQRGSRHRFTRFEKIHEEGFMTEREAGDFLGVSQSTMVNWRKAGIVAGHPAPSNFNFGGTMHIYRPGELSSLRLQIKAQRGLGRGRGSTGRFGKAEAQPLTLEDLIG